MSHRSVLSYNQTAHCGSWMRQRGNNFRFQRFSFFMSEIHTHTKSSLGFRATLQNTTVARKGGNIAASSLCQRTERCKLSLCLRNHSIFSWGSLHCSEQHLLPQLPLKVLEYKAHLPSPWSIYLTVVTAL